MSNAPIEDATINEAGDFVCMARVTGLDGENVTQSTVSAATLVVTDVSTETSNDEVTLTVSSVVFDTLQTDSRWTVDGTGYNFRHTVPAAQIEAGDRHYQLDYKLTMSGGETVWLPFGVYAREIYAA